jgi:hypothetical protein
MRHDYDMYQRALDPQALAPRAIAAVSCAPSTPPMPVKERLRVNIKMRGGTAEQTAAYLRSLADDMDDGLIASRAYRGADGMAVDVDSHVDDGTSNEESEQ